MPIQFVQLKHASVSIQGAEACLVLKHFIQRCEPVDKPDFVDLALSVGSNGLQLIWNRPGALSLKYHVDFEKLVLQQRSFPAPKQGAFNQALGKKTKSVVDATGGWGGDAMLMCMQGYRVILIERLPLMAALLDDAFSRLASSQWVAKNEIIVPQVLCGDAAELLPQFEAMADCIYLDPMFPAKKKKKAATNKQMQLLQWLAGADDDASQLAEIAKQTFPRLAVKRPDYAEPLIANPDAQFSSKLVHYDVYL